MQFVTDRTEEDVLLGNKKGKYTPADLNRVESNVQELARMARDIDVHVSPSVKTDWSRYDQWMNQTQAERYIKNVQLIATSCKVNANVPHSMEKLDITKANDIEKALQIVYNKIIGITGTFQYSGEFYAGEEYAL